MLSRGFIQIFLILAQGLCLMANAHADATKGKNLFENTCKKCHVKTISLKPEKILQVLQSDKIPAHRFKLTSEQQQDLLDYLAMANGKN